jgi:orotate phosphoribosyltransferase
MTRTQIGRETAWLLLDAGAKDVSRQQRFILAARWASPVYVDVRRLVGEPRLRTGVTNVAVQCWLAFFRRESWIVAGVPVRRGWPMGCGSSFAVFASGH